MSRLTRAMLVALVVGSLAGSAVRAQTNEYVGPNNNRNDTWNNPANWSLGVVPTGAADVLVQAGDLATAWSNGTPTFTGDLTLEGDAQLQIGWTSNRPPSYNAVGTAGSTTIHMGAGSLINGRTQATVDMPAIALDGNATISLGSSTQTPATLDFAHGITGPHRLTLSSNAGGVATLSTGNNFSELLVRAADGRGGSQWTLHGNAAGAFGLGDVGVEATAGGLSPQLRLGAADVIADSATLTLTGNGPSGNGTGLMVMGFDDSITKLVLGGVQQATGSYGRIGNAAADYQVGWLSGDGVLTVLGTPALHWDLNGAAAGAGGPSPSGVWDTGTTWNTAEDGTGAGTAWVGGRVARFAAGSDATDAYTVTVSGTRDVAGLEFQEGAVTLSGGELRITDDAPVTVATGRTATIASRIADNGTAWFLAKAGDGTLVLTGSNSYTGVTRIEGGTLEIGTVADAGAPGPLGQYPTPGANGLVLVNGTLRYTGATSASDRGITISGDSVLDLSTANTTLTLGDSAAATQAGTLTVTGAAGNRLALGDLRVQVVSPTLNPTTIPMTLASITGDTRYGTPTPTVTLGGSATGNIVTGDVTYINTHPSGWDPGLSIVKEGTGDWTILGGIDSRGGSGVTVRDGTLTLAGSGNYPGTTAVRGGTLIAAGDAPYNSDGAFGKGTSQVQLGAANSDADAALLIQGAHTIARDVRLPTANGSDTGSRELTLGGNTADNATFSGDIFLGSDNNAGRGVTLTAAVGGQVTFSGVIQDPANMDPTAYTVTKAGPGVVILAGANTYSGATNVLAGTLLVNGNHTGDTYTVAPGATLGGSGTVDALVVNSGIVSPGNSPGSLTVGAMTGLGNYVWEFFDDSGEGSGWDILTITGDLEIVAGDRITVQGLSALPDIAGVPDDLDLSANGALTGPFRILSAGSLSGALWSSIIIDDGNLSPFGFWALSLDTSGPTQDLYMTFNSTIPEPTTWVLLTLGIAGAAVGRRRRRTRAACA